MVRPELFLFVAVVPAFAASAARAEPGVEADPEPQAPATPLPPQPSESPQPASRFALGPSFAFGFTTPSSGNLFHNVYALLDARFVVEIRAVGPLSVRIEPGTTMSWHGTTTRISDAMGAFGGTLVEPDTVRVLSVGVRALAAVDFSSRTVLRAGGAISYGGASLPAACGGDVRGGAGFGGILGAGFRPDAERRWEIGVEALISIYPYADKCLLLRTDPGKSRVSLQENPELGLTVGATWFVL